MHVVFSIQPWRKYFTLFLKLSDCANAKYIVQKHKIPISCSRLQFWAFLHKFYLTNKITVILSYKNT